MKKSIQIEYLFDRIYKVNIKCEENLQFMSLNIPSNIIYIKHLR